MNSTQLQYKLIYAEDRILSHHFIVDNSREKILASLALQKRILLFDLSLHIIPLLFVWVEIDSFDVTSIYYVRRCLFFV